MGAPPVGAGRSRAHPAYERGRPTRTPTARIVLDTSCLGILRAHGHRNIVAALHRNGRDATRVLPLLGITSP